MSMPIVPSSRPAPHFSLVSILAVIAAVISFATHSVVLGFLMAIVAIILGALGFVIALLPGVRGGVVSVISFIGGALGIIIALIRLIGHAAGGPTY